MWDKLKSLSGSATKAESINAEVPGADPVKVSEGALEEPIFTTVGFGYVKGVPMFLKLETQGDKILNRTEEKVSNLYVAKNNFRLICVKLFPSIFNSGPY